MDEAELRELVDGFAAEARALLPDIPDDAVFDVELDPGSRLLVPGYGVGGFAASPVHARIAFDPTVELEPAEHLRRLRGAVFHESFHLAQGFVGSTAASTRPSALDDAIYEGGATVFERERAGSEPPWGVYLDAETMLGWAAELAALPPDYDVRRWKFWDAVSERSWIVYRTGTFLVDRALAAGDGRRIEELAACSPAEILELAGVRL
jgi:hypothetical protein